MTEIVTNGSGNPRNVTTGDHVVTPKRDRAAYMRNYRAKQNNNPETQEPNKQIEPEIKLEAEPKFEDEIAEPEIKLDKELSFEPVIAENKPEPITAEPKADAAAERIKMLLDQINGRDPRQLKLEAYAKEVGAVYKFWEQSGLPPEHLELFRVHSDYMLQLSRAAHNQAVQQHQMNTPEYFELGRKLVFEHLDNLRPQTKETAAAQPETNSMPPSNAQPSFLAPTPAPAALTPRPQKPARVAHYSAPVSRSGGSDYQAAPDPRSVTLSADEMAIAKSCGLTARQYAEQKLRLLAAKQRGELQEG